MGDEDVKETPYKEELIHDFIPHKQTKNTGNGHNFFYTYRIPIIYTFVNIKQLFQPLPSPLAVAFSSKPKRGRGGERPLGYGHLGNACRAGLSLSRLSNSNRRGHAGHQLTPAFLPCHRISCYLNTAVCRTLEERREGEVILHGEGCLTIICNVVKWIHISPDELL